MNTGVLLAHTVVGVFTYNSKYTSMFDYIQQYEV